MARETKAEGFGNLENLNILKLSDLLINATSVGMHPQVNTSAVAKEFLHKDLTVFDIVYNPQETKLIKDAKTIGCQIVYGYKMLLYQAVGQFEIFTSQNAPVEVMEKSLIQALK